MNWLKVATQPFIKTVLLSFTVLIVACSSPQKHLEPPLPSWVAQPPIDDIYIYGVGSALITDDMASTFDLAIKQAKLDIANQLRVTVQGINAQHTQVNRLDTQQEQVMQTLSQLIRVETSPITLESTETEQRFLHTKYAYVLQKLDRQHIISQLKRTISKIDNDIQDIDDAMEYEQALTDQWDTLLPALSLLTERRKLNDSLSLYSRGRTVELPPHAFKVQAKTAQLIRALRIAIDEEGFNNELSLAVSSALSKKGLTPTIVNYADNHLSLFLTPHYEYKTQQQRHYAFVTTSASLRKYDQTPLASWSASARGISSSKEQAVIIANQQLANSLADSIFLWLTNTQ